ncbi:TraG/VirB4 family ATPase [Ensifer sp. SL37]|uniref:VirB4 family type IV secretion/conjugal transfer ATPase n=1 Tax=Ensifer sp. SL37 TaxID=2995137 RepID=UPI002273BF6E|nr:type IV secretion system protein B4 [Ensifer sp. SL37]MCY1741002.1 type IV secretion system protein B4 [Ensifer sp. SL37]
MKHELQFEDDLPFVSLQEDDKTILTRGGELLQCIRIGGLNSMTANDADIEALKGQIADIVSHAGVGHSLYVHKISRPFKPEMALIESDSFAGSLDKAWRDNLAQRRLRDKTLTITVLNRPTSIVRTLKWGEKLQELRARSRRADNIELFIADKENRLAALSDLVGVIVSAMSAHGGRVLTGTSGELIGFLEGIGTGIELPTYPSQELAILARNVANYRPTFRGTKIFISGGTVSNRVGQIFAIKNYPRQAYAGMFDELNLPLDMVITNSFVPISEDKAGELFRRTVKQRRSIGDPAQTDQAILEEGRDKVASGLESFGHHHMTVAIYAEDEETLRKAAQEVHEIAGAKGTKLITEAFAGQGHYFAQWPGNASYRARTGLISNRAFAGMAALHRTPTGLEGSELPWRTPITVFPTPENSAYQFSFHPAGRPDAEPPSGHMMIYGPTGGGKSVLIAFLAAQAARVGARIFAFDYRRGLEVQIKALGGSYSTISPDVPTGLNPLYSETDAAGQMWLSDWLTALLNRKDRPFSPVQIQQLHDAVVQNARAPEHLRNFSNFPALFRHVDDQSDLEQRVGEWAPGGRYGWVFGSNATDNFALNRSVMGFDLTALLDSDHEKERTAILGYVFQRLERKLQDRRPTLIVIDEAWKALATDYFAAKLQNWLVTARKLNAVVMMVTQFPSQLEMSPAGLSMLQAVQTQICIPNPRATEDDYAVLNMTSRELKVILGSSPALRLALVRNDRESVVVDANLNRLGDTLKILGGGPTGQRALDRFNENGDLK